MTRVVIPLLVTAGFLLTPLAVWTEANLPAAWQQRLVVPDLETHPGPQIFPATTGTFLPPLVDADRTLTIADNPVIISQPTRLASHTTLTIEPGVSIVAAERASFEILGTLNINGTLSQPVTLTTNEQDPEHQTWAGLIFRPNSSGRLNSLTVSYASPAITCLDDSRVTISAATLQLASIGLFTTSPNCQVKNSAIHGVRDGVVARDIKPQITNTAISATRHNIKQFDAL